MMKRGLTGRVAKMLALLAGLLISGVAAANPHRWQLGMPEGVTPISHEVHSLYMASLWVCVGIGVVVFGAMIIAMIRFRKSRGAVAEKWSHSTKLELVWTVVPVLILIGLAWPASSILAQEGNTTGSKMTIRVTGYQWLWRYHYVSYEGKEIKNVAFDSRLANDSNKARQLDSGISPYSVTTKSGYHDYLLDVNHPLVVPVGVKIRFAITGGDVIHSWWVPDLGWKKDAIPGIINAEWAIIDKPGVYRGQCAELCGQDHGFMPIVVKALPKAQFDKWLAEKEAAGTAAAAPKTADAGAAQTATQS